MALRKGEKARKVAVKPLMIRVRDRGNKHILLIDANKEKDYKTKYLHIS